MYTFVHVSDTYICMYVHRACIVVFLLGAVAPLAPSSLTYKVAAEKLWSPPATQRVALDCSLTSGAFTRGPYIYIYIYICIYIHNIYIYIYIYII